MSDTQLASMRIGAVDTAIDELRQSRGGNNIFILDGQTDAVLDHIHRDDVLNNRHKQTLQDSLEIFDMTVIGDGRYAAHLGKRNGLIVPGEDGELLEFRIFEAVKYRDTSGILKIDVYANATFLDLKTARVFDAMKTDPLTAVQHAEQALAGTEWQVGQVDYTGIRTLTFDDPFNPYAYLKRIAREFELELRFYVTTDGSRVTGRYVDLVERVGEWRGRTIEFGVDLQGIRRTEKTENVVTALYGYGPKREDGTRLKVFVEDEEALRRWGRNGRHIVDIYEPQTEDLDMTESRLRSLTQTELNKRINAVMEYEADVVDLENVPGMGNKKIRFGDTIRIKDTKFNPALYVEARVHTQERDVFTKANKRVKLGDYKEFTEDEVKAIWKQLQEQVRQKISQAELVEYAERKVHRDTTPPEDTEHLWLDTSVEPNVLKRYDEVKADWVKATPTEADEVGAETPEGAQDKADNARDEAKQAVEDGEVPLPPGAMKPGVINADNNPLQSETAGVYVDDRGILVNSGNFRLQDDITQVESLVRENANMVNDHSFEMVPRGNNAYSSARFNVDTSKLGNYFWWNLGGNANFARIQSTYGTDGIKRAKFGQQAAVLLDFDTTYWWQEVELNSERGTEGPYTLSCYFAAFEETSSTTTCRIALYAYDDNSNYLGTVGSVIVDVSPNEPYKWKRSYVTVRNLPSSTTYLRIILSTWGGGTALADGVQLVPFDRPIVYEAEEGLWKTLRNMAGYTFPQLVADDASVLGNLYVGGGVGDVYANQLRSQRVDGDMYIRPTNNNDVRVASPSGTWRRVLASDFVQQSSENIKTNIEPMSESALELINQSVVYKYNKDGMDEKEYGLIVERETPREIIRGEGVSSYSMISFAWKAVQELSEKVKELERKIGGIEKKRTNKF